MWRVRAWIVAGVICSVVMRCLCAGGGGNTTTAERLWCDGFLCEDNQCVTDSLECLSTNHQKCKEGEIACASGLCVTRASQCFAETDGGKCSMDKRCSDGSCVYNLANCPVSSWAPSCPVMFTRCPDGSCVNTEAGEVCTEDIGVCADGQERCPDGMCRSIGNCPPSNACPIETPILCPSFICARSIKECRGDCKSGFECSDGSCAEAFRDCPAPFTQARMPSIRTMVDGDKKVEISIKNLQGEELFIFKAPKGFVEEPAVLRIAPTARSMILPTSVTTLPNWEEFQLLSAVLTITLTSSRYQPLQPVRPVELCFAVRKSEYEAGIHRHQTPYLSFIHPENSSFLCEDYSLNVEMQEHTSSKDGKRNYKRDQEERVMLCGTTTHFTPFAVLLGPYRGYDYNRNGGGSSADRTHKSWGSWAYLREVIAAGAILSASIIFVLMGLYYPPLQRFLLGYDPRRSLHRVIQRVESKMLTPRIRPEHFQVQLGIAQ